MVGWPYVEKRGSENGVLDEARIMRTGEEGNRRRTHRRKLVSLFPRLRGRERLSHPSRRIPARDTSRVRRRYT